MRHTLLAGILVAFLLAGCVEDSDGGENSRRSLWPPVSMPDWGQLEWADCTVHLTSAAFPTVLVQDALPPAYSVAEAAPGIAGVEITLWDCDALAAGNDTTIQPARMVVMRVPVLPPDDAGDLRTFFSFGSWTDSVALLETFQEANFTHVTLASGLEAEFTDTAASFTMEGEDGVQMAAVASGRLPENPDSRMREYRTFTEERPLVWLDEFRQTFSGSDAFLPGTLAYRGGPLEQMTGQEGGTLPATYIVLRASQTSTPGGA